MREVGRGSEASLRVTVDGLLRGRDVSGDALLALEDEGLVLAMSGGRVAIPLVTLEGLEMAEGWLELYLERGDAVRVKGPAALPQVAEAIVARVCALPELTRALRGLGSRRGAPGGEHDRFFAPLLAARRTAAGAASPRAVCAAFDARALTAGMVAGLRSLAAARYPDDAPERRALEAELMDGIEPLLARLAELERAEAALLTADAAEQFTRWRRWSAALEAVFASADACWLELRAVLRSDRRGRLTRWQRFARFISGRRS